jgi:polyribonucleotide nucleotidyltransferase
MTETQVIAQPISYDGVNAPDVISLVGASAALALSDIPFEDFVSGVRVGRIDGQFVVNPTTEQIEASDIDVIIAGTDTGVMMVEGGCSEVTEEDMLAAVRFGHNEIKQLNAMQRELKAKAGGKTKRVVEVPERLAELDGKIAKEFSTASVRPCSSPRSWTGRTR